MMNKKIDKVSKNHRLEISAKEDFLFSSWQHCLMVFHDENKRFKTQFQSLLSCVRKTHSEKTGDRLSGVTVE